jgi:hypothetical protein
VAATLLCAVLLSTHRLPAGVLSLTLAFVAGHSDLVLGDVGVARRVVAAGWYPSLVCGIAVAAFCWLFTLAFFRNPAAHATG